MAHVILKVPDISCQHCEQTITRALANQQGVSAVTVDISGKKVHLEYDDREIGLDRVMTILDEEDYPVESVERS